ncbi:MAG TPA: sulfotransferase [Thermoanaerobaculia bacterium]|nr:sulfotransferase [Thermoanaerobaculia bacterium]
MFRAPEAATHEAAPPILILSCYRTGSTLLRIIVDTHPQIYSPPEVSLGQAACQLALFAAGLRGLRYDLEAPGDPLPPDVLTWIRATLEKELQAAAARKGKSAWCEKTPGNLVPRNLQILDQVFPDARSLCLHRHCLDVAQSLAKNIHRFDDLKPFLIKSGVLAAAIDYWNERTATLLKHERDNPSRSFRLRYEDLVAAPQSVLDPMFRFLGVSWDEALTARAFEVQHDRGMGDPYLSFTDSIHTRSLGAGRNLSLKGVPERTLETMRSLLRQLDYPDLPAAAAGPVVSPDVSRTPVHDLGWFFETHLPARIHAEPSLCSSVAVSYQFIVTGEPGGSWMFDPRQRRVVAGRGPARCCAEISATDLFAIAQGELHPLKATEQRRLQLRGEVRIQDLEKMMRLLQLPKGGS